MPTLAKVLIAFIFLVVGLAVGAFGAVMLTTGVGAGIGVATGLSSGICTIVKAAQEKGFLTAEQVDEVMTQAVVDLKGTENLPEGEQIAGTAAQCETFLAKLKGAG